MKPLPSHNHDDLLLDRLADGELGGDEYRRLLASLDDRPGGWKRCALALLEAQALRKELDGVVPDSNTIGLAAASQTSRRGRARVNVNLVTLALAVTASFLLAFGLGVWLRGGLPVPRPGVAETVPPMTHAEKPATSPQAAAQTPGTNTPAGGQPRARVSINRLPAGSMTLLVDNGSETGEEMQLPVYDISQVDDTWLQPSPTVPQHVVEKLRSSGLQVRQRRRMVPFELDGQRVIVPMDEVEVVPVSVSYQ